MLPISQAFLTAQAAGETPLSLVFLQTAFGSRCYGVLSPTIAQRSGSGLIIYDGSVSVGDNVTYGATTITLDWGALLVSVGGLRETLTPEGLNILAGLKGSEIPYLTVKLDNTTSKFSDVLVNETILGQTLLLRVGYPSLSFNDYLDVFTGRIIRQRISDLEFEVTAKSGLETDLSDQISIGTSSRYDNPRNNNDPLPVVYGDCSAGASVGVWKAVEIDTVNSKFLIADHEILSVADGNTISVYDDAGVAIVSGFTAYTNGTDENGKTIAYLDFTTAPGKDIYVRCKGKADGATLIENPIDILEDMLDTFGITDAKYSPSFERARQIATLKDLKSAGVVTAETSGAALVQSLLRSFLGDWWYNSDSELVVSLDAIGADQVNIAGFLRESDYASSADVNFEEENICNQATMRYAYNYASGTHNQSDNGDSSKDAESQNLYGKHRRIFQLEWVRDAATMQVIQAAIIAKFASPPRLLTVTENSFRNCHVERGDYVTASCYALRDEDGLPLKNQVWRVLEIERNFDTFTVSYMLQDTGFYYPEAHIIYDGTYTVGGYDGRLRERRDL